MINNKAHQAQASRRVNMTIELGVPVSLEYSRNTLVKGASHGLMYNNDLLNTLHYPLGKNSVHRQLL